jgi:hypothetical protein
MTIPRVRELNIEQEQNFDLFIGTIGYEQRSRFVIERLSPRAQMKVAFGFTADQIFHYKENAQWLSAAGYSEFHCEDQDFRRKLIELLAAVSLDANTNRTMKIGVDISSATRTRIAIILRCIEALSIHRPIEVDFFYALAKFSPPPTVSHPNTHVGPVLPSFSGWWTEPERPLAAALGLGYEENKALGAVEHVQASSIWTFTPESPEAAYTAALREANATLLKLVPEQNGFAYPLSKPLDTFVQLESFVFGITRTHNLIVLPFGPKLFALCAMLVGMVHPEVAVWRVSGGEDRIDREPSGELFGLTVDFISGALDSN